MTHKEVALKASLEISSAIFRVNEDAGLAMVMWPKTIEVLLDGDTEQFDFLELVREARAT